MKGGKAVLGSCHSREVCGCVRTVFVRGSTLMSEIRAWITVILGSWLCVSIAQDCLLRCSWRLVGDITMKRLESIYNLFRYPRSRY